MTSPGRARPWETSPVTYERHNGRSSRCGEAMLPADVAQRAAPFTLGEVIRLERRRALPSRIVRSRGATAQPTGLLPASLSKPGISCEGGPAAGAPAAFLQGTVLGWGHPRYPKAPQTRCPPCGNQLGRASRIWPHTRVVGRAFLLPVVMLCCQLGASRNYPPKQGAGVLLHPPAWSSSQDAALPHC